MQGARASATTILTMLNWNNLVPPHEELTHSDPLMPWILVNAGSVNSLWPSDTIQRQISRSTLALVMACCLTAPSHYLSSVRSIHLSAILQEIPQPSATEIILKISYKFFLLKSARGQWVDRLTSDGTRPLPEPSSFTTNKISEKTFQWNFVFLFLIQENMFESITILFRLQCVHFIQWEGFPWQPRWTPNMGIQLLHSIHGPWCDGE